MRSEACAGMLSKGQGSKGEMEGRGAGTGEGDFPCLVHSLSAAFSLYRNGFDQFRSTKAMAEKPNLAHRKCHHLRAPSGPHDPSFICPQCFLLPFSAFRVPPLEFHYGTPQIAQNPVNFGFIFSTKKSQESVLFIFTLRIFSTLSA